MSRKQQRELRDQDGYFPMIKEPTHQKDITGQPWASYPASFPICKITIIIIAIQLGVWQGSNYLIHVRCLEPCWVHDKYTNDKCSVNVSSKVIAIGTKLQALTVTLAQLPLRWGSDGSCTIMCKHRPLAGSSSSFSWWQWWWWWWCGCVGV